MKKFIKILIIGLLSILPLIASDKTKVDVSYTQVIKKFKSARASKPFFKTSYGYAIFPSVGKGGLFIAGAHGKGRVYIKGKHIADTSLSQITLGFQAGGQAYSQIMFFRDKYAFSTFKTGNFQLGAQATAVAINKGVGVNADYDKGIAIFTIAKGGLMYEASVGGQKFTYKAK